MKVVFFGTSDFAAQVLCCLKTGPCELVAIVTRPDRPQGRSLRIQPSPVKEMALQYFSETPLLQPEKASTQAFCEELASFSADLFLVVAYGEILRQNVLLLPKKACVNIHTSLLPKYRGASPIQSSLLHGDTETGVTFMEMVLEMDAGDILKQERVLIEPNMTKGELEEILLDVTKKSLPDLLLHLDDYYRLKVPQESSKATYVKKIAPEDGLLDLFKEAVELHNKIRAFSPSPGAFINMRVGNSIKRMKILKSFLELNQKATPGQLLFEKNLCKIGCKGGYLLPQKVQLEGKKGMGIEEFMRGAAKSLSIVN